MGFAEIIGHSRQIGTLRHALAKGRLHHAYLFVGPEGVGKRTVALALAKAIHCAGRGDDFCDRCVNCARIQNGNHPDLRLIEMQAGKKEISIQQIREIDKQLNYRSFTGGKKIIILDPATLMNFPAQNALLKTLEEPPQDSLMILIAGNTGGLLPTLRSRCLQVSFGPLQREHIFGYLVTQKGMQRDNAVHLAGMAMGSLGNAVKIDGADFRKRRQSWIELLSSLKTGDYRAAAAVAETLAANKDETAKFLAWVQSWYRDLLVHTVTQESKELINLDLVARIERESVAGKVEYILCLMDQVTEAAAGIQRNLNRRMIMENLLFSVVRER
ncbi:MAG TPA: DNA polymerase III subunit delta' [Candidatus Udaeobacter sp.]|jgi:DNA polymerase-3 subunit delta'|nr:DNA polymerase III subunit delta' [Candidatus Udaeobacter sp.]